MAGIAFKEEVLSYGTDECILMDYSETPASAGCLD